MYREDVTLTFRRSALALRAVTEAELRWVTAILEAGP